MLDHVLISNVAVWSNFEIADMEFWRGEAYQKFFDHLESKGGFYYEVSPCLRGSWRIIVTIFHPAMGRRSSS